MFTLSERRTSLFHVAGHAWNAKRLGSMEYQSCVNQKWKAPGYKRRAQWEEVNEDHEDYEDYVVCCVYYVI